MVRVEPGIFFFISLSSTCFLMHEKCMSKDVYAAQLDDFK